MDKVEQKSYGIDSTKFIDQFLWKQKYSLLDTIESILDKYK